VSGVCTPVATCSGKSGTNFASRASSDRRFDSIARITSAAVNCFVTEPMRNIVSALAGTSNSRSAMP
jgi:hypothetical protein